MADPLSPSQNNIAAAPVEPMADPQHTMEPRSNANMPIQLTLQVGSVTMELGRLLEINAGTVLSDEVTSFFPKVRVLAGDRAIAEGELVQIEGKVGLRVSKLFG